MTRAQLVGELELDLREKWRNVELRSLYLARVCFSEHVALLVLKANTGDHEANLHWVYRDWPGEIGVHPKGLAVDLNLFRGGDYLKNSEDHRHLGAWWKTLHPLARWGGDFRVRAGQPRSGPDGNHYSFRWEGRA